MRCRFLMPIRFNEEFTEPFYLRGESLLTELLSDKGQVQNVNDAISIGVWGRFAETVGHLQQIQDIDPPIAVDIGNTFGREIDFAVKVGSKWVNGAELFPLSETGVADSRSVIVWACPLRLQTAQPLVNSRMNNLQRFDTVGFWGLQVVRDWPPRTSTRCVHGQVPTDSQYQIRGLPRCRYCTSHIHQKGSGPWW